MTPEEQKDVDELKAQAAKALIDRDRARDEAKDWQRKAGSGLSDDQRKEYETLKADREKTEEDRKRKAGEYDALLKAHDAAHEKELAKLRESTLAAETKARQVAIGKAFADATDLFGREALTIYQPSVAERIFASHVEIDEHGAVTVKDRDGTVIKDKAGKPAAFREAMRTLITSLPDKDDHLRGSGKSGSGNQGGGRQDKGTVVDILSRISPEQMRDPKVREQVRRQQAEAGGLTMGKAWDTLADSKR